MTRTETLDMEPSKDAALSTSGLPYPRKRRRPIVPDEERKRVKAACLPCRSNKLKCNGQRPCQRCQKTSSVCHFADAVPQNRHDFISRQSEREQMLEVILHRHGIKIPDSLDALRMYAEGVPDSPHSTRTEQAAIERIDHSSQRQEALSRNSGPCASVHDVHNAQEESDGSNVVVNHVPKSQTYVHDQGKTFFNGRFSTWAFFDSVHETVARDQHSQSSREATTAYKHFMTESPEILMGDLRSSLLAALPPREVLDFLTSTFFRYCQSNFFWVHPAIFSRKLDAFFGGTHEFSAQNRNATKRPAEFICSLFMVLALGSQFAELDQDRHPPSLFSLDYSTDTSRFDISKIKVPILKRNPGWRFYQISRRLLSDVVCSCSMTSIQACALQGAFLITTSAHDIAYNMWGLAVRMSVNMGLHQAVRDDVLHPHVRELRNRLWWSVTTLDSLFGYWIGRPKMFDDSDVDTPFPEDLPELQLEQPTGSSRGQIALIKICRIIDRIVKKIYPSTTSPGKGQVINMASFVELQDALEQWRLDLPAQLKLSPTSTRGTIHLHLTQQHAVMLMTRTSLSHAAATAGSRPSSKHLLKTKFLHDAGRQCISAAMSTIGLLKGLHERGLMCQYSFQDPLYCTAALCVLLLAVKLEPPGQEMKKVIIEGILILQHLSSGSETANSSLEGIIKGFKPFLQPHNKPPTEDSQPSAQTTRAQGRKAWEAWANQPTSMVANHPDTSGQPAEGSASASVTDLDIDYSMATTTNKRDEREISRRPCTDSMPPLCPDYQSLAFDDLMDTWTRIHPFWFSELDDSVEGLGQAFP